MIRKGKAYAPFEILPKIVFRQKGKRREEAEFDGDLIDVSADRLQTFARHGIRCTRCGIEGRFFYKERRTGDSAFHFNLYATDPEGNEVLMVKDSVFPKSSGTTDDLRNWQTMCAPCKQSKRRGAIDQMDVLSHVVFTNEGVEVLSQVYAEVKLKPERLANRAFLQDDGTLLLQAEVGDDLIQVQFPPGLWRWAAALPMPSDEEDEIPS